MTQSKEQNKSPVSNPKYIEIYVFLDTEFKIFILEKIRELQKNIYRQLTETRNTHEKNETINNKKENIKKN